MKTSLRFLSAASLSVLVFRIHAATVPYSETFDSYGVGDLAVPNFTEVSTLDWTLVPSYSGNAYQNVLSVFSGGIGIAAGQNSSSGISFPSLASSSFSISTTFRIDTLTLSGSDVNNTAAIGLFARSSDAAPASSAADRYQVSYYLDDDGLGHGTGKLWLREFNLFYGDSVSTVSAGTLAVTLGDIYTLTLSGTDLGGTLALLATLTDNTTSSSISVAKIDALYLAGGGNFGYFNNVRVEDGGTVALNADFDHFAADVPEPGSAALVLAGITAFILNRRRMFKVGA